jgi:hypothetical protein
MYKVAPQQNPCGKFDPDEDGVYWGDYDDMVWLGGSYTGLHGESWQGFYTTFTRNGPGASMDSLLNTPMDVYGATLW